MFYVIVRYVIDGVRIYQYCIFLNIDKYLMDLRLNFVVGIQILSFLISYDNFIEVEF